MRVRFLLACHGGRERKMAELVNVIDEDGIAIVINLDYVVQMQPTEKVAVTAITLVGGQSRYAIYAKGTPQQIATAPRLLAG